MDIMYTALSVAAIVLLAALWLYVASLMAPSWGRTVLTLGALRRRVGRHAATGWHILYAGPRDALAHDLHRAAIGIARLTVDPTTQILARKEMQPEDVGAENWGDLLQEMSTAERVIYHLETYELHMALRRATAQAEREFSARIDEILAGWAHRTEHVTLGSSESPTGEWPLMRRELVAA